MTKPKQKKTDLPKEIDIHYIKTPSYRSYHVDGAFGGLTPKGNIYCEFFVDRNITPQIISHKVKDNGSLGEIKKTTGKNGLARQIECGIVLDINTAIAFKDWLNEKIKQYKKDFKSLKQEE